MTITRRYRIRRKVKKFQKKRRRLKAKLSELGLEDFTVYIGRLGYRLCLAFDRAAGGPSDSDILTPAELTNALSFNMLIYHVEDKETFDTLEDFRKYVLIKKLSGIE